MKLYCCSATWTEAQLQCPDTLPFYVSKQLVVDKEACAVMNPKSQLECGVVEVSLVPTEKKKITRGDLQKIAEIGINQFIHQATPEGLDNQQANVLYVIRALQTFLGDKCPYELNIESNYTVVSKSNPK